MDKIATVATLTEIMGEIAPVALAEEWDNVGLMLGRRTNAVTRVLLALDFTAEVLEQAVQQGAELIITHHPAIFSRLGKITDADWQQELLLRAAEKGIAVYSAHTNLDCAEGGVNDVLARRLQLEDVEILDQSNGLGRIGTVAECSVSEFALLAKKALAAPYVNIGDAGRSVKRVAICGGAGSDLINLALARGADTLLTGDVKYHSAQQAVFRGLNIIDAGHQATEMPVLEDLSRRISKLAAERGLALEILIAKESLLLQAV